MSSPSLKTGAGERWRQCSRKINFPRKKLVKYIREFDPAPLEERGERWRQRSIKINSPRKKLVKYQRVFSQRLIRLWRRSWPAREGRLKLETKNFLLDSKPSKKLSESLILAQDERWRRV